jgi:hypothetical protein
VRGWKLVSFNVFLGREYKSQCFRFIICALRGLRDGEKFVGF